ncbi:MAG TPA: plastocyanin/azurin family copper-binding protein [Acidimicrobiales bacterium]|nr:plastocyanin/azurin family copper-binding protein [Acidimicrobiales bacterium]
MRWRFWLAILTVTLVLSACNGGSASGSHLVLVDHTLEEFPTSFFGYFPRVVEAHPGDTVHFRQEWTGEPHTITLGTLVQPLGEEVRAALRGRKKLPDFVDTNKFGLPSIFPEGGDDETITIDQRAAQPCYVASGPVPADVEDCARRQPSFDGTQSFYNSGYIPYRGRRRNEFDLPLSSSIKPGSYFYYCVLHGATMGGFVDVKRAGATLLKSEGLRDRDLVAATKATKQARARASRKSFRLPGTDIQAGTFSYYVESGLRYPVAVNEFMPNKLHAKVGAPVTWSFVAGPGHTVSFDVPAYLPAIVFRRDGQVDVNPDTLNPIAGPGYPTTDEEPPEDGFAVDAGRYNGSHFLSSGYNDGPMRYSVTFTKPGTYPYACLIHPSMIGKVVVNA